MPTSSIVVASAFALGVALIPVVISSHEAQAADPNVDQVFSRYSTSTPGCAVGVANGGTPVFAKGYGMADLEHDVPITPQTIFEAGSVSKQFTAAAVMLLAREGKLSLDDQARKYIPELPDFGSPLTVRHMLTHTSGLRDWGSVAGISGWPRTSRAYTHAHVLEIVGRQRMLNFTPGTRWSYSNTGFNLAAIIVERLSGMTFQEFTRARLFEPLAMTHTSWRADYTRIVKGRALAYRQRDGAFYTDMPFENVYGNGGLLTTVGDLLKWNQHYDAPPSGDAALVAEQQQPNHFTDGRAHRYGLGLYVGMHNGVREVYHSGSTAGYQAFLTRFPDQHLSVAVLCNVSSAAAGQYARAVADAYLAGPLKTADSKTAHTLSSGEANRFAGMWKSDSTGLTLTIGRDQDGLFLTRIVRLLPQSPTRLITADGEQFELDAHGIRRTDGAGTTEEFSRAEPVAYTDAQLAELSGTYASDEAETTLAAVVENHALVLKRRPDTTIALTPVYADAFAADHGLGTVIFRRDSSGRVTSLSVAQDRVWNMRFEKREVRSKK